MNPKTENWHQRDVGAVIQSLATHAERGLSASEAALRLTQYGRNELKSVPRTSAWSLLLAQFKNVLILILLTATTLSAFLGHGVEAIAIAIIVLFAVFLGFVQEYRAERAIEALKRMAAPTATVLRDGAELEIPARDLAPGDVILLKAGDRIPADARLIQSINLQVEESALTGESVPTEKMISSLTAAPLGIGDRKNMVYSGTLASYGRGRAVVVTTGMETEFGKITGMLQSIETMKTPLQKNLDRVGKMLAKASLLIVAVIVTFGIVRAPPKQSLASLPVPGQGLGAQHGITFSPFPLARRPV